MILGVLESSILVLVAFNLLYIRMENNPVCGSGQMMSSSTYCGRDALNDMFPEIFKRLPLKSQCRFKCVSKSWRSLITNNFLQTKRRLCVGERCYDSDSEWLNIYSIDEHGVAIRICNPICSPIPRFGSGILFHNHCNGLFCFYDDYQKTLGLCSPATGEKILLSNNEYCRGSFDFGFDPLSNKFKVLGWAKYPRCQIYTLGTCSWRPVTSLPEDGWGIPSSLALHFNGRIYWSSNTNMIISFDLGNESFGVIQLPKRVAYRIDIKITRVCLFKLEGCLCLADLHDFGRDVDFWMLKDLNGNSNWVMMTTVTLPSHQISLRQYYSTRTGEIVIAEDYDAQSLCLYSFITQQFYTIKVVGVASNFVVTDYLENLVSLKDL